METTTPAVNVVERSDSGTVDLKALQKGGYRHLTCEKLVRKRY